MKKHECACNEYRRLSRRGFLATSFGTMAAITTPAWLPRVAYAQSANSARDVVVSIFLRGGIDGLTAVVPHGDENYYRWRRRTAVDRPGQNNGAVDLDGFFGLAPGMSALKPAYDAGDLLAVHATGSTDDTRSHFDAQRFMEIGKGEGA